MTRALAATEDLVVVREAYDSDGDPSGAAQHVLRGCSVAPRLPSGDDLTGRERTTRAVDIRVPDRTADLQASDLVRRPGEPATGRARWRVEGEPARSPFRRGGLVAVLTYVTG